MTELDVAARNAASRGGYKVRQKSGRMSEIPCLLLLLPWKPWKPLPLSVIPTRTHLGVEHDVRVCPQEEGGGGAESRKGSLRLEIASSSVSSTSHRGVSRV